jgi:hypothetical protein
MANDYLQLPLVACSSTSLSCQWLFKLISWELVAHQINYYNTTNSVRLFLFNLKQCFVFLQILRICTKIIFWRGSAFFCVDGEGLYCAATGSTSKSKYAQ